MSWLVKFWYQDNHPLRFLFYPLHLVLTLLIGLRRAGYKVGLFKSSKVNVPVIVIGNITVGGTGKSPLVIYLAEQLTIAGFKVGILSRGYGGKSATYPQEVTLQSLTSEVGDEPLMLKQRTGLTVVVDPNRSRGARYLSEQCQCDLIICDDGLQHYGLQRDIEIMVVDAQRQFGNKLLMPFGPLRENVNRASSVDAIVINGSSKKNIEVRANQNRNKFSMKFTKMHLISLLESENIIANEDVTSFCKNAKLIHAVAGIGNPERFFNQLDKTGLTTTHHSFNDHHNYSPEDFVDMDGLIIMTEKDAVKCRDFATESMWYLKVDAEISPSLSQFCIDILGEH